MANAVFQFEYIFFGYRRWFGIGINARSPVARMVFLVFGMMTRIIVEQLTQIVDVWLVVVGKLGFWSAGAWMV